MTTVPETPAVAPAPPDLGRLQARARSLLDVFLCSGIPTQALIGIALIGPLLLGVGAVLLAARQAWPSLHNVADNPLTGLLKNPREAVMFACVALFAGGVREEVQRAFLLTRFERDLGGPVVGLVVTSIAFGAGHAALQGWDAALATGLLGAVWGVIYLRRRSAIAPMVSHAGFNSLEIVRYLVLGAGT
jgi:membrane protease YdiL (CAAX protease family)